MVPGIQEIRQSCEASWSIMMGRTEAMRQYDLSADGFWRSFGVIFLLLPLYLFSIFAEQNLFLEDQLAQGTELSEYAQGGFLLYSGKVVTLLVDWIAFPIIVGFLSGSVGLKQNYAPYIIARNWSTLVILVPQTVLNLGYLIGIMPSALFIMLSFPIVGWVLWYRFRIARIAGQCSFSISMGLVVLDLILSIFISLSIGRPFAG